MATTAKKYVAQANSWLGLHEDTQGHHQIIDLYNSRRFKGCGFKMKYTGEWCAAFVSACAIKCKATDIIPVECHCNHMIKKFKKKKAWIENENVVPQIGDIVFYDWQDNGKGNDKDPADHVGIVESVDENAKTFVVIEGNYKRSVKRRKMKFNAKCLRGFARPKYLQDTSKKTKKNCANNILSRNINKLIKRK